MVVVKTHQMAQHTFDQKVIIFLCRCRQVRYLSLTKGKKITPSDEDDDDDGDSVVPLLQSYTP